MRILVVGGTGFIGSRLVSLLRDAGHDVTLFHRGVTRAPASRTVPAIAGDRKRLGDHREALRTLAPDVVIDTILSSGRQAESLMDVFRGAARRIVALSSMDVYRAIGVAHRLEPGPLEPLPLTEESPLRTRLQTYPPEQIAWLSRVFGWLDDEYDKIPVERVVLSDAQLPGTVLRLPMVYGPGDPLHRLFPILKRIDDGRPAIVLPEGTAAWRSSYGFVDNVARAVVLAVEHDSAAGRTYNVAEPDSLSQLELTEAVARITAWRGRIVVVPDERAPAHLHLPGNTAQHWVADSTRIRRELGYREVVDRDEALGRTIAWERAHPPAEVDPRQFDYEEESRAMTRAASGA